MKKAKKLFAALFAVVMVLSVMSIPAFAANTTSHTITINNEKSGHTYTAYQVFAGDLDATLSKLSNIEWGSGVNGSALLTALQTADATTYGSCTSAEDVAKVLAGFSDDSDELDAFAKIVGENLGTAAGTSTESPAGTYKINVTGDGYYFVKDTGTLGADDAATKYILQVTDDVAITAKSETPTITKKIVAADAASENGTAVNVGDTVQFKLTSKVPEMDGYGSYTFEITDTLAAGLTAVDEDADGNIDVTVKIDGTDYTSFTVAGTNAFTITFTNFINQKVNAGKTIEITYSATLNDGALATKVETNTAQLKYSNDPYNTSSFGTSVASTVYVYDFDIVIDKYTDTDGNGAKDATDERLENAKFVLYKTEGGENYYYKQDNGTKAVSWVKLADSEVAGAITAGTITELTTDANGAATFQGLDTGTYYLKETAAPDGYNLLKTDTEVTITATYGADGQITSSSAASDGGQYKQTVSVENKSGTELPSTGGIGTTIFYVVGGVLVVAAVVLLVTKKRMSSEK